MDPVEIGTLTTYELANDGTGVLLNFADVNGQPRSVYVPVEMLKPLTLTMPKIMLEVLQAQFYDPTLRLVHAVDSWWLERASDGKTCILAFTTPDHFSISYNVNDQDLSQLSDAVIDHELDAFPQGLQFQLAQLSLPKASHTSSARDVSLLDGLIASVDVE